MYCLDAESPSTEGLKIAPIFKTDKGTIMRTKLSTSVYKTPLAAYDSPVSTSATAPTNIYRLGGLWETYMFKTKPWSSYERYGRAVSRFLEAFPNRKDINSFTRPEIISWVQSRFAEGASVATVRTELAAVRAFFQFCTDMGQAMINPAKNIRVTKNSQTKAPNDGMMSPCREGDGSSDGDSA